MISILAKELKEFFYKPHTGFLVIFHLNISHTMNLAYVVDWLMC